MDQITPYFVTRDSVCQKHILLCAIAHQVEAFSHSARQLDILESCRQRSRFFKLYIPYVQIYAVYYTAGAHQRHYGLELLYELCYTPRQNCFACNLQGVLQESGNQGSEDSFQCQLAGIIKVILCYTYCIAQLISKLKMCP